MTATSMTGHHLKRTWSQSSDSKPDVPSNSQQRTPDRKKARPSRRKLEGSEPLEGAEYTSGDSTQSSPPTPFVTPTPPARQSQTSTQSAYSSGSIPTIPLLYHLAVQAHQAAHYHLRQCFVPSYVEACPDQPIHLHTPLADGAYTHDPEATSTALRFLVLAADLLRAGLASAGLSDREKSAFGLEFATVAIKILKANVSIKRMPRDERKRANIVIDTAQLDADLEVLLSKSLATSRRSPVTKEYRQGLEIANATLAFMMDKANMGKNIIKQALADTPNEDFIHRYRLHLLLMNHLDETRSKELFKAINALEKEAKAQSHTQIIQLCHIARVRAHFPQRRWDNLKKALDDCAAVLRQTAGTASPSPFPSKQEKAWDTLLTIHYLFFRSLYEGRSGEDKVAGSFLKRLYYLMDEATEEGLFSQLRNDGGIVNLILPGPDGQSHNLYVQSTPINVLYALTFLTTAVSRPEYIGSNEQCRSLVHTNAMREYESLARTDDLWDSGFSTMHGLADALDLRWTLSSILAEDMLEQASVLIARSSFKEADELLTSIVIYMRENKLHYTHMPHLALLYAQFAHSLGWYEIAEKYYRGTAAMVIPGSEFRTLVEIGLLSVRGHMEHLQGAEARSQAINRLADMCRSGNNLALHTIGCFLLSLTEPERVQSKRWLTNAYESAKKVNHNLLYNLIFAFTTTQHVFGNDSRQLKQLEAGRHVSSLFGGRDRPDGVGKTVLGLWFATHLRDAYARQQRFEDEKAEEESVNRHLHRLQEIREFAERRFGPNVPQEMPCAVQA